MFATDESVALISVNIPSRTFTLHSDMGNELVVDCQTSIQFQEVLKVVRSNANSYDVHYDF